FIISLAITAFNLLALVSERGPLFKLFVLLFVYGFIPLIFLVGVGLLIYNTQLMHSKEGKSFTAKLSMFLGLNLLVAFPLFFLIVSGAIRLPNLLTTILLTISLLDIVFTFLFIGYLIYSALYQLVPVRNTVHYIIILGAGIRSEEVTSLLKSRLDKALQYQTKQKEKIKFVVSGGQGADEPVAEAFAMRKYLLSQGIPNQQIIYEDQSTTTLENLQFSKKLIEQDWEEAASPLILFSTSNRSEEHTSELQSRFDIICRLLIEKKKNRLRQVCLLRRAGERGFIAWSEAPNPAPQRPAPPDLVLPRAGCTVSTHLSCQLASTSD